MSIQGYTELSLPTGALGPPDVQAAPVAFRDVDGSSSQLVKIDLAIRLGSLFLAAGWSTTKLDIGFVGDGQQLEARQVLVPRPDVAAHFGMASGDDLGFVLVVECPDEKPLSLSWRVDGQYAVSRPLQFSSSTSVASITSRERAILGPALGMLALAYPPFSEKWRSFMKSATVSSGPCRSAKGFLEGAVVVEKTRAAVVYGWLVHTPSTVVWLEDDTGHPHSLEGAFHTFRQDVHDAVGQEFGHASREAGFLCFLDGVKPGSKLRLKTISESGVHVLDEKPCNLLPVDPVGAAHWLFGVATPFADLHRRVPLIDEPLISPLIQCRQDVVRELPVHDVQLGQAVEQPSVSVIVPLYGRADFVENQLIEFAKDPWFAAHAELIYVLDDPKLLEAFTADSEYLHRIYRVPFRWLWGSVNRGYSGANNLGASRARGEYLLFLNSDAFPQAPGWIEALTEVLATRPDIGAVGVRLLFADGSIQHAGMEFVRRGDLGVWVNHHPNMGLDPSLDPNQELVIVPSVTGACLAMRRADFDRIDGWDTGYLIGDFEDSDLCMKLRAVGLSSAYLPSVQLTHLERQSFKLLGQGEFRSRVVIYNAVRHQQRWSTEIAATQEVRRPAA
jgi:O-antigen biosynthesis protein